MELRRILRDLYCVIQPLGCTEEEIAAVRELFGALPAAVEDFWRMAGRTRELDRVQDKWAFPETYRKWESYRKSEHLILLMESQGCCRAVVRREDLTLPDPPVYTWTERDGPWALSASSVSEFLEAALTYEAVWQLDYAPEEFYWLSDGDLAVVQAKLTKLPVVLHKWFDMEISFYSSRPDNLVVVMDVGDQYQALYGGATEESYAALLEAMKDLGEPI